MKRYIAFVATTLLLLFTSAVAAAEESEAFQGSIYPVPELTPVDSELLVQVGDPMPDFTLPAIDGSTVSLGDFAGKQNFVLSFIPAAWTPVCSGQWPGYNIAEDLFAANNTALIGVSVDNIPTLYAWVEQMGGLWFPVVSDFWPHGELAQKLGILRSEGETERALFLVDSQGIIRYIDVHDINTRPDLGELIQAMQSLNAE